ncbi:MAG TPA: hypothetical protein VK121_05510 [Pseudogracilibacillus sp.]|nr:hypothetical protein [Pseudogracilibacillus sp.]
MEEVIRVIRILSVLLHYGINRATESLYDDDGIVEGKAKIISDEGYLQFEGIF